MIVFDPCQMVLEKNAEGNLKFQDKSYPKKSLKPYSEDE